MNGKTRRGVLVLSLAGLAGLGYYAWAANRAPTVAPAPEAAGKMTPGAGGAGGAAPAPKPVAVEMAVVEAQGFSDELSAVGTLKAAESVVLRPEVSGRVARIGFRDGAVVRRGDLLIALDATIPDAEVAQARANVELARTTFKRNQELLAKKFISPQALDASAATLKVQEAALRLAQAKAAKMRIVAPFAGVVGLRDVSVGGYVKEGEELVNVEDLSSLRVDFRLPETHLGRLRSGLPLEISSDALPGQTFTATVEAVDPQIDAAARSIAVRARFDNREGKLRPGMFVRVRLVFGERKGVLMIPEEAVIPGAKPRVFRVVNGQAEAVPVRLGVRRDARVEVSEGLAAGDLVVTAGQMKLRPGASVRMPATDKPAQP